MIPPSAPEHGNHEESVISRVLRRLWLLLPQNIRLNLNDTFQPEDINFRRIPGEEVQIVIRMAWYRDILGHLVFNHFWSLSAGFLLIALIMTSLSFVIGFQPLFIAVPILLLIVLAVYGVLARFEYYQWRLLKTNARLIISIPQQGAWPLVDNIELKGAPAILDTNWSPNPLWRIFQFFTGARDLYVSMSGLQFVEGRAKVRDALIIPDIMPEDVFELKKLVFTPK